MTLTHTPNQVAKDHQLLDTTRDYLRFVTSFFEVIDVSATHIYHSALELSPLSSVVRKVYYSQRPLPLPRVVIGARDTWDDVTASVSITGHSSNFLIWSPCGHFIAVAIDGTVEIRGALALNLLSTLQSAVVVTHPTYSPDGHSLACCFYAGIIIWDIQTGGVIGKINHLTSDYDPKLKLVWSFDGNVICVTSSRGSGTFYVHVYEVASGIMRSFNKTESKHGGCAWAHDKSFRVMTTTIDDRCPTINIYEVGSTLTKIEQFHFHFLSHPRFGAFSPATYRISVRRSNPDELLILDVRNSEFLLQKSGFHYKVTFSPDGNFVAAISGNRLIIWRYISGRYTQWWDIQRGGDLLQFSPTSSSILIGNDQLLHVFHFDHSPAAPTIESGATIRGMPLDAYPSNGAYIATTHRGESAITIINLRSQNPSPSQFIDTGLEIYTIALTGNVLLVVGPSTVVTWLLTEEGVLGGTFGERRVDRSDSLWDAQIPSDDDINNELVFSVEGEIAAVGHRYGDLIRVYHTKTGEIFNLDGAQLNPRKYYQLGEFNPIFTYGPDRHHYDSYKSHEPPQCRWLVSYATSAGGWVKDSEGKHRLWLHPRWRWFRPDQTQWLDQVTTLRLSIEPELVVVKF